LAGNRTPRLPFIRPVLAFAIFLNFVLRPDTLFAELNALLPSILDKAGEYDIARFQSS
jgi:hypothetical protein